MLMDESLVAGGLAISGIFDLEPIGLSYLNEKLGLDAEQAWRNSPSLDMPALAAKFIVAYGSDELQELKRQSREFGAAWSAYGLRGEMVEVPTVIIMPFSNSSHSRTALWRTRGRSPPGPIQADQLPRRFDWPLSVFKVNFGTC